MTTSLNCFNETTYIYTKDGDTMEFWSEIKIEVGKSNLIMFVTCVIQSCNPVLPLDKKNCFKKTILTKVNHLVLISNQLFSFRQWL